MKQELIKNRMALMSLMGVTAVLLAMQFSPIFANAQQGVNSQASSSPFLLVAQHDDDEGEQWDGQIELYSNLLSLVQQVTQIAEDPTASGVAAVMGVEDHFENEEQAIKFLEKMLQATESKKIKRAIHMKLLDLYSKVDQTDKAQEQLEKLIVQ